MEYKKRLFAVDKSQRLNKGIWRKTNIIHNHSVLLAQFALKVSKQLLHLKLFLSFLFSFFKLIAYFSKHKKHVTLLLPR